MTAPDAELTCYYHPDQAATSQCDRCGDFLCPACVKEYRGQFLCGRCTDEVRQEPADPIAYRALTRIISFFAWASLLVPFMFVVLAKMIEEHSFWFIVIAGNALVAASLVVYFRMRPRRLMPLSLAFTNGVAVGWTLLWLDEIMNMNIVKAPWDPFVFIPLFIIPHVLGVILAAVSDFRREGSAWDRFAIILVPTLWLGAISGGFALMCVELFK